MADALVRMAEIALDALREGDTTSRRPRGDELAAIVVHVNAETYPAQPRSAERGADDETVPEQGPGLPAGRIDRGPGLSQRSSNVSPAPAGSAPSSTAATAHRSMSDAPTVWSPNACTAPCSNATGVVHIPAAAPGAACTPITCGTGCTAARRTWPTSCSCAPRTITPCPRRRVHDRAGRPCAGDSAASDGRELLAVSPTRRLRRQHRTRRSAYRTDETAPTTRWEGDRLDRHFAISVIAERRYETG